MTAATTNWGYVMTLKSLMFSAALAAAAMGAAGAASAKTIPLVFTDGSAFVGDSGLKGSFMDSIDFTVSGVSATTFPLTFTETKLSNITDPTLALVSSTGMPETYTVTSSLGANSDTVELDATLSDGSYVLEVSGDSVGKNAGSYGGVATITSAAPEPASWALMIVGVGLIGGALRFSRRGGSVLAVA